MTLEYEKEAQIGESKQGYTNSSATPSTNGIQALSNEGKFPSRSKPTGLKTSFQAPRCKPAADKNAGLQTQGRSHKSRGVNSVPRKIIYTSRTHTQLVCLLTLEVLKIQKCCC